MPLYIPAIAIALLGSPVGEGPREESRDGRESAPSTNAPDEEVAAPSEPASVVETTSSSAREPSVKPAPSDAEKTEGPEQEPQEPEEPLPPPDDAGDARLEGLLDGSSGEDGAVAGTVTRPPREEVSRDEQIRAFYEDLYRPASNPIRPYFSARAGGGMLGSSKPGLPGGRVGSVTAQAGFSFNRVGAAVGARYTGGQLYLNAEQDRESLLTVAGMADLTLGRTALRGRGYIDPHIGWEVWLVPTRPSLGYEGASENWIATGPRFSVDAGLMTVPKRQGRVRHALGIGIAWSTSAISPTREIRGYHLLDFGLNWQFG